MMIIKSPPNWKQNWESEIVLKDSELNSIHNSSGFLDCKYLQESIHSREKVDCQM